MIVIWGIDSDGPVQRVREELEKKGAPTFFLDQRRMLETEIDLDLSLSPSGELRLGQQRLELGAASALYLRPRTWQTSPELEPFPRDGREWRHAARLNSALLYFCELTRARVVNRIGEAACNGSKPHQAQRIRAAGFNTPQTLVTTDADAVRAFHAQHAELAYKSVSGTRSIVSRLDPARLADLADVGSCPTQFQAFVPGDDYRVHTVGKELFATRIVSDAVDYRYAAQSDTKVSMEPAELPSDLAEKCIALAQSLGLLVAGIDLRKTPDGQWYCFEVNPSPGFSYFEHHAEQPIAEAIARLLLTPL